MRLRLSVLGYSFSAFMMEGVRDLLYLYRDSLVDDGEEIVSKLVVE